MAKQAVILDFEAASRVRMLERVRALTSTRDALMANARDNHAIQAQIHGAILALLDAKDWAGLDARLQRSVRAALNIDFLGLFVENAKLPNGLIGVHAKPEGFVAHVMQGNFERLGPCSSQGALVYGDQISQMHSEAFLRLDWGPGEALLVFGSKDQHAFVAAQGTELIAFFAKTVERLISRWAS
ncbi:MAG: DUF484 family protein [Robiginitomaculum sp.]|nr:DUF484 family protein [Robiginitomaculum sp.]